MKINCYTRYMADAVVVAVGGGAASCCGRQSNRRWYNICMNILVCEFLLSSTERTPLFVQLKQYRKDEVRVQRERTPPSRAFPFGKTQSNFAISRWKIKSVVFVCFKKWFEFVWRFLCFIFGVSVSSGVIKTVWFHETDIQYPHSARIEWFKWQSKLKKRNFDVVRARMSI